MAATFKEEVMRQRATINDQKPVIVRRDVQIEAPEIAEKTNKSEPTRSEKKQKTSYRIKRAIGIFAAKVAASGAVCLGVGKAIEVAYINVSGQVQEVYASALDKITITKIVHEMKPIDEVSLGELVEKVAKEAKVDPLILHVIVEKESSGGRQLYHFEPELFSRVKPKFPKTSDDELRMLSSSHGIFHVLGFTAKEQCGLHWAKLYDPLASARCAASIVSRLHKDSKAKDAGDRLWAIFYGYNGKGPKAQGYADEAMRMVAARLYEKVAG